ncbi:60S ribosomal protein L7-4-like [Hibiscus syriacus]|uniref:60S ribosomal protein L7-4-like n=1 Tax=Hibiscus syriacus TaxID=106335 RepID=A0A6A2WT44_HIBSY|nr:coniferyl alcohol acyltransferase-like [Hibiscus syriacus]KAE8658695.1 60S ribosomal protein L7-4-like [Hibiscus syriacus]
MGSEKGEFTVTVSKTDVVAPLVPFQEHWLPFTNLDLLLPPLDFGVIFCYNKPVSASSGMVSVLKKALAEALLPYYALAAEVVPNALGEPELLCNNRGVDFVEAYADIELRNLNFHNPDESVEGKLVPKKKHGVMAVQATELKCGGIVVGCSFDHRVSDAYTANMFLVSWAELAQSKPVSVVPSFRRSLLNPRRPGCIDPSLDDCYVSISSLPPPEENYEPTDHLISRMYYVNADQLNELQSLASSDGEKRTKLESFSAYLWKMVATYTVDKDRRKISKLGIVVDGRARLGEGDPVRATVMRSHFGNVLSIPYGSETIGELTEKPLCSVAKQIHEFLKPATTKEHFLGAIDWVEAHRPEPAMTRVYNVVKDDGPALVVSSGLRFPVSNVDFGWGCPAFGSYHFPWGGLCGYVMPMPSTARDGDWVVYMLLLKGQLEQIEKEAAHVFRPLTSDYLDL